MTCEPSIWVNPLPDDVPHRLRVMIDHVAGECSWWSRVHQWKYTLYIPDQQLAEATCKGCYTTVSAQLPEEDNHDTAQ